MSWRRRRGAHQHVYITSLVMFGLGTVSFLAGLFGFARTRRQRPGTATLTSAPAIEQITEASAAS